MTEGRIIKGVGGLYTVATDNGNYSCGVRGIFRKKKFTPINPAVGDYVFLEMEDDEKKTATITKFKERKTELIRPRVANIDQCVIVMAAESPAISLDLLDRLILLTEERKLETLICINKSDITDSYTAIKKIYQDIGYNVVITSANDGGGIDKLKQYLSGKVSVFAGPSGVGKSSIVNSLLSYSKMETGGLSLKIERGKHTTRHAELIEISENTYVVDSPGFTSLIIDHILPDSLDKLFREFAPYLGSCRFNDCRHVNEPDCAIKAQVGIDIYMERYMRYVNIYNDLYSAR